MVNVSQGTLRKIRVDLFTHMESLPIKYFDTHSHGDIMSIYTNDTDTLRQMNKFNELNEELFDSANNANGFANILMPINVNLGNLSYVICAIAGSVLAITGFTSFTLGALASFLQLNKSFNQPISQVSQQLNSVVMALAGAQRIFNLMDEESEVDEGYVTISKCKRR